MTAATRPTTVPQLLRAAASHIFEFGWTKGQFADIPYHAEGDFGHPDRATCRTCALGAMQFSLSGDPFLISLAAPKSHAEWDASEADEYWSNADVLNAARFAFRRHTAMSPVQFNDSAPDAETVIDALLGAADQYENDHPDQGSVPDEVA